MSAVDPPEPPASGPDRRDNGLHANAYVALTDVEPDVGRALLVALGRARIAAYLADAAADESADRRRLFVASDERTDARTIVAAAVRALAGDEQEPPASDDPLAGVDTDSAFRALVADWHVDTHTAIRNAERDLSREDAEWRARLNRPPAEDPIWLDDDHYIPPPPPPLPRLAAPTIAAMVVLAVSIVVLGAGGLVGLAGNFAFVLGIVGILLGAGMLFSRLHNHHRDEDDDGAAL